MFRKSNRKIGEEPRKLNAFGWSRKRGGAGAVACGIAVAALLLVVILSPSVNYSSIPPGEVDEPRIPDNGYEDPNWDPPVKPVIVEGHNAGFPSRLPI
jgi:hypothetical protein